MSKLVVNRVKTPKDIKDFHKLPDMLYREVKDWIKPLTKDVENVFSSEHNPALANGNAKVVRWTIYQDGQIVGRIAAFTNKKYKNKGDTQPTGGIGFFESTNDMQVATLLFDTAKEWLIEQGMEAMDGPINLGERDKWWGLLVSGFQPSSYCVNYHLPYYKNLFKQYGFQTFYEQYCFHMYPYKKLNQAYWDSFYQWDTNEHIEARHFKKSKLKKYANDFAEVYNAAWASHGGMKTISARGVEILFKKMLFIINPHIIWFVYYKNQPIALWVNIPEINEYIKHLNGQWNLWAKIKMLFLKFFFKPKRMLGLVFGVIPAWQSKGIDRYMIVTAARKNKHFPNYYEDYEIQWIGDFNGKMMSISSKLEATKKRTLITFRYLFDREKVFHRHPKI